MAHRNDREEVRVGSSYADGRIKGRNTECINGMTESIRMQSWKKSSAQEENLVRERKVRK